MQDVAIARRRAERCFAVARSTTFDGERSAAIDRGLALLRAASLDPDEFDIPGRPRPSARRHAGRHPARDPAWRPRGPEYDAASAAEAVRRFRQSMERAAAAAGVTMGESPYDADRPDFDATVAAAAEASRFGATAAAAKVAADILWGFGIRVYPGDDPRAGADWLVEHETGLEPCDHEALVRIAILERRWREAVS